MLIKYLIEEKKKDMEFAEIYDGEGRKLKTCIKETTNLGFKIDMYVDQALINMIQHSKNWLTTKLKDVLGGIS